MLVLGLSQRDPGTIAVFMVDKVAPGEILLQVQYNSTYPDPGYPDRLGSSVTFVENSTQIYCFEITGYRIKYSTVLWLLEPQIRRGRKV